MSTLPPSSSPDDPLARAEAAFRRTPVPEGPSEAIVARTLAALKKAESDTKPWPWKKTMLMTMKIAAAVLVAVGGAFYFAADPLAGATAFAEVTQKLRDAHTLAYRSTIESPDLKTRLTMRSLFKEPSSFRIELDGGTVAIADARQGKQVILDPATKIAVLLEGKTQEAPLGPAAAVGLVERLRQLSGGDAKYVGDRAIGTIQARGYLVKNKTILGGPATFETEMTVWVDPETRLPLRVESSDRFQGKEIRVTSSDFQIDPEVDDAQFRVAPPPGYALREVESDLLKMDEKTFLDLEKAATALLRFFAEKHGGTFPRRIDDLTEYFDEKKTRKPGELPDAETMRNMLTVGRFMMASRQLKGGFGYRSEGVKLGDADQILFWYRPEGAADYRAIYGDLHASDVTEDRLPEKPKP